MSENRWIWILILAAFGFIVPSELADGDWIELSMLGTSLAIGLGAVWILQRRGLWRQGKIWHRLLAIVVMGTVIFLIPFALPEASSALLVVGPAIFLLITQALAYADPPDAGAPSNIES